MKAEVILDNSVKAREAINALEREGISKSSISISSPSRLQVERLLRLQSQNSQTSGFSTFPTVLTTAVAFATLALVALIFTNSEVSLLVKTLTLLLAGSVGAFLSFIVSQFRFSSYRFYNRVEITDEDSVSDKVALEFSLNKANKEEIVQALELYEPNELNFKL